MCRFLLAFLLGLACGAVLWLACSSQFWRNLFRKERIVHGEVSTHSLTEDIHQGEDVLAKQMAQRVRVLCVVSTNPRDHHKAVSIKATWGKHCGNILFMSTKRNTTIPTVVLPETGIKDFWGRTKSSFKYVYKHHLNFDWVLKTTSDTYVIVENLRYLLSDYNSSEALYFGRYFKRNNVGFMSAGSGYVLSKEAVRRLVEKGLGEDGKCKREEEGFEDSEMGRCLSALGVEAVDSRDSLNRGRFFPFRPEDHIHHVQQWQYSFWYSRVNYFKDDEGLRCCSDLAISFRANPVEMYTLEYYMYHWHPYGIRHNVNATLNRRGNESRIKDFDNQAALGG